RRPRSAARHARALPGRHGERVGAGRRRRLDPPPRAARRAAARRARRADARAPRACAARRGVSSSRAVIDLGSNSFRLVAFTTGEGGWWKRTDELSDMVRIGGELTPDGGLSDGRMAHALETLRVFAAFCTTSGLNTDAIDAVATSAIREAPNGADFVAR